MMTTPHPTATSYYDLPCLDTSGGASRHTDFKAHSPLHRGAASTWRGWALQASSSAGSPATSTATMDGQASLTQQPPTWDDGARRWSLAAHHHHKAGSVPGVRRYTALLVSTLMDGNKLRGGMHILETIRSDLTGSVVVVMPPQGAQSTMLELPFLQASGCFVSSAIAVFALPRHPTPCQGLLVTSSPATSFELASFRCLHHPSRSPCSLGQSPIVDDYCCRQ